MRGLHFSELVREGLSGDLSSSVQAAVERDGERGAAERRGYCFEMGALVSLPQKTSTAVQAESLCRGSNAQADVAEERTHLLKLSLLDDFKFLKQKPGHQLREGQRGRRKPVGHSHTGEPRTRSD